MKTIGLLGGTSWPSTADYYLTINEMVNARLGGFHSAEIILRSIDYNDIKSRYGKDWDAIPPLLKQRVEQLAALKPDIIAICNNTLHKAFDQVASEVDLNGAQLVHIVDEVGLEGQRMGVRKVLLLGTKLTMEDGYYAQKLRDDFGLAVDIPNEAARVKIQELQTAISTGSKENFGPAFRELLMPYNDFDAVVLACTELPLVVKPGVVDLPILNPTYLQCRAAVNLALA